MIEVDPNPTKARLPIENKPGDGWHRVTVPRKIYRILHVLSEHLPTESELDRGDHVIIDSDIVSRTVHAEEKAIPLVPRAVLFHQDRMNGNNHWKPGQRLPPVRKGMLYNDVRNGVGEGVSPQLAVPNLVAPGDTEALPQLDPRRFARRRLYDEQELQIARARKQIPPYHPRNHHPEIAQMKDLHRPRVVPEVNEKNAAELRDAAGVIVERWETVQFGQSPQRQRPEDPTRCNICKAPVVRGAWMCDDKCDCPVKEPVQVHSTDNLKYPAGPLAYDDRIQCFVHRGLDFRVEDPVIPADAPRIIFQYRHEQDYDWHNFMGDSSHQVEYMNKVYPTAEHLYQSFKFQDPKIVKDIRTCGLEPGHARAVAFINSKFGFLRNDWLVIRTRMRDMTLIRKFTQHENLKKELLATGDAEIVFNCPTDDFWGVGPDGKGKNELGKSLMRTRARLVLLAARKI